MKNKLDLFTKSSKSFILKLLAAMFCFISSYSYSQCPSGQTYLQASVSFGYCVPSWCYPSCPAGATAIAPASPPPAAAPASIPAPTPAPAAASSTQYVCKFTANPPNGFTADTVYVRFNDSDILLWYPNWKTQAHDTLLNTVVNNAICSMDSRGETTIKTTFTCVKQICFTLFGTTSCATLYTNKNASATDATFRRSQGYKCTPD